MQERPISISGTTVHFHAWDHDTVNHKYDFKKDVQMLSTIISNLFITNSGKLICIEGQSGSGKSAFAKVLESTGVKCKLIDVFISGKTVEPVAPKIEDASVTYIIDDASYAEVEVFSKAISHVKAGGCIVLLLESISEVQEALELDAVPVYFKLNRSGLSKLI
ncbi:hypothetical protein [Moritella sp. F3]|uniref:hypothetical protein n=1 Tax=Moritella sp. F3 TaxID=2718882 RepID=UPI0018E1D0F8|nr:hypothetical protein [Moritella sp. F3]GIC77653.1 hypothetical protein FMO001_23800 [Moritella sp. F1]GIC82066.1 hypothetical protein FMO003_23470 [Moritella sp. F3]